VHLLPVIEERVPTFSLQYNPLFCILLAEFVRFCREDSLAAACPLNELSYQLGRRASRCLIPETN